jgi:cytochrome c
MKRIIIVLAAAVMVSSCGSNESKPTVTNETKPAAAAEQALSPEAEKGLELIAGSDCLGCHKIEDRVNGPAYREVAAKYAGQPGITDTLARHIIKGHVGTWGDVEMTPHPNLSEGDAKAMVTYILSLKQQP